MSAEQEVVLGGVSTTGLARRRGLAWFQGYGVYITNKRLMVTRPKVSQTLDWHLGAGSMLGSFGAKPRPFMDKSTPTIETLENSEREFECPLDVVNSVELERPGDLFRKGSVHMSLVSGKDFSLGIMEESEGYGGEAYNALVELFQTHLGGKVKTT